MMGFVSYQVNCEKNQWSCQSACYDSLSDIVTSRTCQRPAQETCFGARILTAFVHPIPGQEELVKFEFFQRFPK